MTKDLPASKMLKILTPKDIRVLYMVETLLKKGEYAPVEQIATYTGYHLKDVTIRLDRLHKLKLVKRWQGYFIGYTLTFAGYDTLALNALNNQKKVYALGSNRGVGKESDLYYAIDFDDKEVLLKINRTGRMSFQQIRRKRDFLDNKRHFSVFFLAEMSASREYEILKKLGEANLPVPKVYGYNRHIIVMEIIEGVELIQMRELPNPEKIIEQIVNFAKTLYHDYGIIHGDLTEFNMMYNPDTDKITFFDFPQIIDTSHPDAKDILTRDISHIIDFFTKKYKVGADVNSVISYILGEKYTENDR